MKAVLNVDGKRLEVTNISYEKDKVVVVTVWDDGKIYPYYDANCAWIPAGAKVLYLNELLEYPTIEQAVENKWTSLVKHLEAVLNSELEVVSDIAFDAFDSDDSPFNEVALLEKQREFKIAQSRATGFLDALEEVKAFMEGWYSDDDTRPANETEVNHQTT